MSGEFLTYLGFNEKQAEILYHIILGIVLMFSATIMMISGIALFIGGIP